MLNILLYELLLEINMKIKKIYFKERQGLNVNLDCICRHGPTLLHSKRS